MIGVFIAQFNSDCENCESRILAGQEARMIGPGQAVHAKCPKRRSICPDCHLVHGITQVECE